MSDSAISANKEEKKGLFARIGLFVRQVVSELKKVVYPTKNELLRYTWIVLGFVAVMMALVFFLDMAFGWAAFKVFGN